MSLHQAADRPAKSVAEHGVCFGLTLSALVIAALAIQWILQLVP